MGRISLAEMKRRLSRITEPMLQEQAEQIILSNPEPLKKEKEAELLRGKLPSGEGIGTYRSKSYARKKSAINSQAGFGNVDLIYSGKLLNAMSAYRTTANNYTFSNNVNYGEYLIKRYGIDIMGLSQEEFVRIQKEYYLYDFIKGIKRTLGQ